MDPTTIRFNCLQLAAGIHAGRTAGPPAEAEDIVNAAEKLFAFTMKEKIDDK